MKENKDKKEIWKQKVKASKTRQYSFDTVSGKINKLLYYPENLDDHYFNKLGFMFPIRIFNSLESKKIKLLFIINNIS